MDQGIKCRDSPDRDEVIFNTLGHYSYKEEDTHFGNDYSRMLKSSKLLSNESSESHFLFFAKKLTPIEIDFSSAGGWRSGFRSASESCQNSAPAPSGILSDPQRSTGDFCSEHRETCVEKRNAAA